MVVSSSFASSGSTTQPLKLGCRGSSGCTGVWGLFGAGRGHRASEGRLGFRLALPHGKFIWVLGPSGARSYRGLLWEASSPLPHPTSLPPQKFCQLSPIFSFISLSLARRNRPGSIKSTPNGIPFLQGTNTQAL